MPIFEYECNSCNHEFEELVFSDELPICPKCNSSKTHKVLSRPCKSRNCAGNLSDISSAPMSSGGGCAGCAGGSCASCK